MKTTGRKRGKNSILSPLRWRKLSLLVTPKATEIKEVNRMETFCWRRSQNNMDGQQKPPWAAGSR